MGMGSKPGYGPRTPSGVQFPSGGGKKRKRNRKPQLDRGIGPRLTSSDPAKPKLRDTMSNRKNGGSGTYYSPHTDGRVGRDLMNQTIDARGIPVAGVPSAPTVKPAGQLRIPAGMPASEIAGYGESERQRIKATAEHSRKITTGEK